MEGEWTTRKRANGKMGNRIVKRPVIFPLTRTRARIYRSFYFFAVTSVTAFLVKRCFIACYVAFCTEFNNRVIRGIENQWKREGKARFSGLRFWGFPLFFL